MTGLTRSLIIAAVLGTLLVLGFQRLIFDHRQGVIDELEAMNAAMQERLESHQEMIRRLGREHRLAHVRVAAQTRAPSGEVLTTDFDLIELDDDGSEIARQRFTVPGDVVFIDAWTVKFHDEDVAAAHPLFGRTLVLLRRVYSDRMPPAEGIPIDLPGAVPPGYAAGDLGRFEQQLWTNFWTVATDATVARSMGVRVAQGEAIYKPVVEGQSFDLVVDADGGMSLTPLATTAAADGS